MRDAKVCSTMTTRGGGGCGVQFKSFIDIHISDREH